MTLMWNCISLAAIFTFVSASKCNLPPSLWCSNDEVAKRCGVLDQCRKGLTPDVTAEPVNFTLYYESLCNGCRDFIKDQLFHTYMALGESVMNLTLVPYGNAKERKTIFGHWKFNCQHGREECVGNVIETCALNMEKNKSVSFQFIHCMEGIGEYPNAAKKCAPKFNINYDTLMTCANGDQGAELEHIMAVKTGALDPPHKYVPWVTLNGVHTEEIENKAMTDLMSLICETYKGPKPHACKKHVLAKIKHGCLQY